MNKFYSNATAALAGLLHDNMTIAAGGFGQCGDEILRYAAQPESARSDRHVVVEQAGKCSRGVWVNFAHMERDLITDYTNEHG